jgi:hypothetical protein
MAEQELQYHQYIENQTLQEQHYKRLLDLERIHQVHENSYYNNIYQGPGKTTLQLRQLELHQMYHHRGATPTHGNLQLLPLGAQMRATTTHRRSSSFTKSPSNQSIHSNGTTSTQHQQQQQQRGTDGYAFPDVFSVRQGEAPQPQTIAESSSQKATHVAPIIQHEHAQKIKRDETAPIKEKPVEKVVEKEAAKALPVEEEKPMDAATAAKDPNTWRTYLTKTMLSRTLQSGPNEDVLRWAKMMGLCATARNEIKIQRQCVFGTMQRLARLGGDFLHSSAPSMTPLRTSCHCLAADPEPRQ